MRIKKTDFDDTEAAGAQFQAKVIKLFQETSVN
jgi:hypothetical protein